MALVHPDKSSIADCCLKEVIPEWLPGTKIFSVCAVIGANLVSLIYTIHEMIIHVNEIGNLKALKWLVSKCLFYPFVLFVWSLSRSEEHTSELQSHSDLVCRLLLEK